MTDLVELTAAQRAAHAHVAARSRGGALAPSWRVTINFHPDRPVPGGVVLDLIHRDGRYRSQFETGTSAGGLTAHPGGARWEWESRIFGRAYDDAPASERPVYGALATSVGVGGPGVGGSPRFGSAHLRLREGVLGRSTFCYPDSVFEPVHFGVADRFELLDLAESEVGRGDPLDDYIEAHVHGPVRVGDDVEALVLDPSFRGTAVEEAARDMPVAVEWHAGFEVSTEALRGHDDYRGPEFVALAVELASDGVLTPRLIGEAARTGDHDDQDLKRVWHLLARYGAPLG